MTEPPLDPHTVPDPVRAAARLAPGQWIGLADPAWSGEGRLPAWALIGQWLADGEGRVTEYRDNDAYRPSPLAYGWPDPTDPVDAAIQLAATGYGPPEDVHRALAGTRPALALTADGAVDVRELPDGPGVLVFSDDTHRTAAGVTAVARLGVADLLEMLPPGHRVVVNLGGPVAVALSPDDLRAALECSD